MSDPFAPPPGHAPGTLVRHIPESIVEGKRLGRHVRHDPRSLAYRVEADGTVATKRWNRVIPILDQGDIGSCTGEATVGVLGTEPFYADLAAQLTAGLQLNQPEALLIYSDAEKIDGGVGYPPEDQGSSGLSVAQAAKQLGLIAGYQHITSVAAAKTAIQTGPFIIGSDWYDSFDTPDANGLIAIAPGASVRGGHEYECLGYDATADLWECVNSWGLGWGVSGHFFMSSATLDALLSTDGDATTFVPVSQPAPQPKPQPTPTPPGPGPSPGPIPTPPSPHPDPNVIHEIEVVARAAVQEIEAVTVAVVNKIKALVAKIGGSI